MTDIDIRQLDAETFQVTIRAAQTTTHQVKVSPAYAAALTQGRITTIALVKRSFEFLLQRESNTSILSSFELSVISRYFSDYEQVIGKA